MKITEEMINQGKKILVFSDDYCGDCIRLKQYIEEIIEENPEWDFIAINQDENLDLYQKYNIFGIPSFVALKENQKIGELISKSGKSKQLINNWIKTVELV